MKRPLIHNHADGAEGKPALMYLYFHNYETNCHHFLRNGADLDDTFNQTPQLVEFANGFAAVQCH